MSPARTALVALLVVATALFAIGVLAERSQSETHTEPARTHSETGEPEGAHEEGEATGATEGRQDEGAETAHADEDETLLGVDLESTPLLVLAVLAGLGLAAACASRLGERSGPLFAVAAIALAWAALDVREVAHQLDESNTGIALIAIAVAVLHVAAASLAARLAARARQAGAGSTGRPGTMPA
jgi:hypothetical protein